MPESLEIPLSDLNEWLKQETTSIVEPLRADAKKLLEDTQDKLEDLLESCDKLLDDAEKEIAKGSRKTYRRAKALQKLAGKFADLIDETTIPEEISGKSLHQTCEQIEKTLKTIIKERTKWFRAISPYFIISRRRFDVALKRADDSFRDLADFLSEEYAEAESAEGVSSKIEELRQSLAELEKYEKSKEARKHKRELLEKNIAKAHQKVQAIQTKDEVVELAQINDRIKELRGQVKRELRHLQKPFLKFQTLANNPGYSLLPEETKKLDEYMTKPFEALATEKEGHPLLSSILQKIDTALDNKKLKLKSSRLRKAKDQINSILNKSALLPLHQSCSEAFSKKHKLSTSGTISKTRDRRAELQNRLKELQTRKRLLEARDARFKKKHTEARMRVEEQKRTLENIVSDLSDKNVQLLID
jgi:DNA repair exonuclease SbcCD ATPase subunit